MKCPFCRKNKNSVIDTRDGSNGSYIWRRRRCDHCEGRFTTYERIEESPRKVIKKDQTKEEYDQNKIRQSLEYAVQNRPETEERLEEILANVEQQIFEEESDEIPTQVIGEAILEHLKKEDKVAYIRYASVFKSFDSPTDFVSELKSIVS